MMTAEQLKASILQLAMEGKLVEQSPEEGTGEELYQKIQAEKATLVKEGKITKQKSLPEITDDEKPFDIPESWRWTYIGEIFDHNTGKALNGSNSAGKVLSYITTSNLYWNRFELDKLKRMPFTDSEIEKCTIHKGDLLVCEGGDYGRAAIWPFDYDMRIQNHIHRLRPYVEVSVQFYYYLIRLYKLSGRIKGKGIGIQGLSSGALHKLYAPLPPLREQYHIVKKIEELMPFVNQYATVSEKLDKLNSEFPDQVKKSILQLAYATVSEKLDKLNSEFPDQVKKSILQLAVEGKLVEQRPEEGTGEELFRKIQDEKAKLIKEGKIKKQKPLADITDEEKPFDIPSGWKWVRLGNLISIKSGDGLTSSQMVRGSIPVYGGNGITGYHNKGNVHKETVVIGRVGYYCGSIHITAKEAWVTDNAFITAYPESYIDRDYFTQVLKYMDLGKNNNATAQPVVSGKKIYPLLFPLPPLQEQKRIVLKLSKVLPYLENIVFKG